jgi:hypothetical protein
MQMSMFSSEVPRANRSRSRDFARDLLTHAGTSHSPILPLLTDIGPSGWFGRTSPASCQAEADGILVPFSGRWFNSGMGGIGAPGDPMFTLQAGKQHAIAFDPTQITSPGNYSQPRPGDSSHPLAATAHPPVIAFHGAQDPDVSGDVTHPLGRNQGQEACIALSSKDHCGDASADLAPTLRAMGHDSSHANAGGQLAVAVSLRGRDGGATAEITEGAAPALRASQGGGDKPHVMMPSMQVRRLMPSECEALQGFPEVQKCYTILVCRDFSDQQKSNALAALQNRRLRSSAWSAGASGWMLSAEAAAHHSSTSHHDRAPLVAIDVLIDLERQVVRLHSAGRSLSLAGNAGERSEFPLPTGIDSFAHLAALLTQTWALTTPDGKVASQANIKPSSPLLSGRCIAISFGRETAEPAGDVANAIKTANRLFTSTTLPSGLDTEILRSILTTLSCCVVRAIAGCIPETTSKANCFAVRLTTNQGHTSIPWRGKPAAQCPDGPRYKALGNSMAVPVVEWIGRRIEAVESAISERERAA